MITKVSVVCLTRNHERFIAQTLESILSQDVDFDFEIIVCDDCSDDNTAEIVKDYTEKYPDRIRLIKNEARLGATKSSLKLLTSAKGEYLAGCEGDDFWTSNKKLKEQIDFLERHKEYVGCVHDVLLVNENGEPLKRQRLNWISNKTVFTLSDFDGVHIPGHINTFVRRNFFRDNEFCGDLIENASAYVGDRTNFLLWLEKGDIYKIKKKMSAYRVLRNGNNLTTTQYARNKFKTRSEYEYVLKLQQYLLAENKKACFLKHKKDLFVDAVVDILKYGKDADRLLPKQILREAKNCRLMYILYLPIGLVKKVWIKAFFIR